MTPIYNQLLIPFLTAMVVAITMGGSGTAPAFSASYGANVMRKSLIPGLFGIMVFVGAFLAGKKTASTMGSGILPSEYMDFTVVSIALFSIAVTMLISNISGIPQSTSQAAVLALAAPALYFNKLATHTSLSKSSPLGSYCPLSLISSASSLGNIYTNLCVDGDSPFSALKMRINAIYGTSY